MNYHRTPPLYKPDAIPTKNGWVDPQTKELLVSVSIPEDIINKWKSEQKVIKKAKEEIPVDKPEIQAETVCECPEPVEEKENQPKPSASTTKKSGKKQKPSI